MRVLLTGPPGAGKSTQGGLLARRLDIPHVSSGELLWQEIDAQTLLGYQVASFVREGLSVPDDVMNLIMADHLAQDDCASGFVLDGYPRNPAQAAALDRTVRPDVVVHLFLDPNDLVKRSTGRRYCRRCGSMYHLLLRPPRQAYQCDRCGGVLVQRENDWYEVVLRRIREYEAYEVGLEAFFRARDVPFLHLYGSGLPEEVHHRLAELTAPDALRSLLREQAEKVGR